MAIYEVGKSRLRPSRQAAKPYVYASATLVVNARIWPPTGRSLTTNDTSEPLRELRESARHRARTA